MAATLDPSPLLTDDLLVRCHERASRYDREQSFFTEDFDELRDAGYLQLPLPAAFGGRGLTLAAVAQEQRRLAYFAPPTAHALTMHLAWVGVASDLWRGGDRSLAWVLEEAAAGHVFAAGHGESGNDVPVLASTTRAERVDGGYRLTGHKTFGSLTPVWTYLGLHGVDHHAPGGPRIVHAFMPRHTEGYAIRSTGDTMGMRAMRSDDTILDGAFIPDRYVARVVPAGVAGIDPFVLALLAWSLLGYANVALGMARRALDLSVDTLGRARAFDGTLALTARPGAREAVAGMGLELEAIEPHLEYTADEWTRDVDHRGRWPMKLLVANRHAVEGSWRVVDAALDLAGSAGIVRRAEIERLFRDARVGRVHASYARFTHDVVGRTLLGLPLDDITPIG